MVSQAKLLCYHCHKSTMRYDSSGEGEEPVDPCKQGIRAVEFAPGRRKSPLGLLAAALVLVVFLLAGCSGGSRFRVGRSAPPTADVPETTARSQTVAVPETQAEARSLASEQLADGGFEDEDALAVDLELSPEIPAIEDAFEIPFDPEEPAVNDDEIALLDELIGLDLPDPPRVLSHEEALLHTRSELPLVMNEHVRRQINYFTKNRRGIATVKAALGRGAAYRPMIDRILEEEDVPAEIFYLAMAESGFRPKARSHARATGMWQFISSRGKQYGLRQDRYVDLRYDPETATRAAARHLKDLHIEFGDWYLAMAAYNGGPNRVKRGIQRTGSRDYWTLVRRRVLFRETRNYVPIILALTFVGQNLDLFEFGELDPAPEKEYDTIRTETETSFALIADASGSSVEAIKELNQALLRSTTPPYGYDLRLPKGTAERVERELALVPPDKRLNWRRYEVSQGETLEAIARKYKVKADTLAALNSLAPGGEIPVGTRLTVPTTTRLSIYRYYGGGAGGLLEPGTGRYRIASGDTLGGIARRFGTTVTTLMAWNGLPSTRIRAGRYLIVQPEGAEGSAATAASSSGTAPTGRYKVRRGDTLSAIGARVGASVAQLRSWNGIRGSTIRIGQVLKVPGPPPTPARTTTSSALPSRAAPAPSANHYRIRPGDSLSTISARFGVSVRDLRQWNGLRSNRITAGKFLLVRKPDAPSAKQAASSQPAASSSGSQYVVKRGDTLGGIAERYGTTASKLRAWNGIRGSRIHPGQKLIVRAGGGAGTVSYRIRRGDTLGGIAKRFNVTVNDLMRWNRLRTSTIHPGKTLVVQRGD